MSSEPISGLTPEFSDRDLLAFESAHPRPSDRKDDMIRAKGISPVRYYQRLNQLIDVAWAREEFPAMLARLDRLRSS